MLSLNQYIADKKCSVSQVYLSHIHADDVYFTSALLCRSELSIPAIKISMTVESDWKRSQQ
jgi:hypothetical protein